VGRGGGVQSGGSELPSDGVRLVVKLHFLNFCPKSGELRDVSDRDSILKVFFIIRLREYIFLISQAI
jgi:hypothetical protein